jgi:hypothetical protein
MVASYCGLRTNFSLVIKLFNILYDNVDLIWIISLILDNLILFLPMEIQQDFSLKGNLYTMNGNSTNVSGKQKKSSNNKKS